MIEKEERGAGDGVSAGEDGGVGRGGRARETDGVAEGVIRE